MPVFKAVTIEVSVHPPSPAVGVTGLLPLVSILPPVRIPEGEVYASRER